MDYPSRMQVRLEFPQYPPLIKLEIDRLIRPHVEILEKLTQERSEFDHTLARAGKSDFYSVYPKASRPGREPDMASFWRLMSDKGFKLDPSRPKDWTFMPTIGLVDSLHKPPEEPKRRAQERPSAPWRPDSNEFSELDLNYLSQNLGQMAIENPPTFAVPEKPPRAVSKASRLPRESRGLHYEPQSSVFGLPSGTLYQRDSLADLMSPLSPASSIKPFNRDSLISPISPVSPLKKYGTVSSGGRQSIESVRRPRSSGNPPQLYGTPTFPSRYLQPQAQTSQPRSVHPTYLGPPMPEGSAKRSRSAGDNVRRPTTTTPFNQRDVELREITSLGENSFWLQPGRHEVKQSVSPVGGRSTPPRQSSVRYQPYHRAEALHVVRVAHYPPKRSWKNCLCCC